MAPSASFPLSNSHPHKSHIRGTPNVSAVLTAPRTLSLQSSLLGPPSSHELQIRILSTGICGSDVSYYRKFANGALVASEPMVLGHESCGEVVAIGEEVEGWIVGERVALEVGVPCGRCSLCRGENNVEEQGEQRQGRRYNLCKGMRFRSSAKSVPHWWGTLQERINHPAAWCHRIPYTMTRISAALLEPLSVALHALSRASLPPTSNSHALVIGAGTIGLLTSAMALRSGCKSVTICDIDPGRLAFALGNGFATSSFLIPTTPPSHTSSPSSSGVSTPLSVDYPASRAAADQFSVAKALAAEIVRGLPEVNEEENEGFDVAFECTGRPEPMQTCILASRPGGKVIMVGMGSPVQTLPLGVAHLGEVDLIGVFRYAGNYPRGIELLSEEGEESLAELLAKMVTHRFDGLERVQEALDMSGRTTDDEGKLVLKVVIDC